MVARGFLLEAFIKIRYQSSDVVFSLIFAKRKKSKENISYRVSAANPQEISIYFNKYIFGYNKYSIFWHIFG